MKVKKTVIKSLIKECLIEILAEGLGTEAVGTIQESKKRIVNAQQPIINSKLAEVSNKQAEVVAVAAQNSVIPGMAEILADTYATTYKEQNTNELPSAQEALRRSLMTENIVEQTNDNITFAQETVKNNSWEAMAFGSTKIRSK